MAIRFTRVSAVAMSCALAFGAALTSAQAQSVQKQCGAEWKAAKAAGTVQAGQKWADFLAECRTRMAAQPAAATSAPAAPAAQAAPANPLKPAPTAPAAEAAKTPAAPTAAPAAGASAPADQAAAKKPVSPGRAAETTRQKQCGAEWRANKAQLRAQTPGLKWPQYWHECNTRLKAAAGQ